MTVKVLNKYVIFRSHPKSLDGSNVPSNEILKEFGFLDINTAIVGAIAIIKNKMVETSSQQQGITREEINDMMQVKTDQMWEEIRQGMATLHSEVTTNAHTYTDIVTDDLKRVQTFVLLQLSTQLTALGS